MSNFVLKKCSGPRKTLIQYSSVSLSLLLENFKFRVVIGQGAEAPCPTWAGRERSSALNMSENAARLGGKNWKFNNFIRTSRIF